MSGGKVRSGGMALLLAVLPIAGLEAGPADGAGWAGDPVEVAAGAAHRGPWMMNQSNFDYVDDPAVAIAADGHIAVAWADQPRQNIFLQMHGPDGAARFAAPVNVSDHPGVFSWLPRVAVAPGDPQRLYVLWQEIVFSGGSHGGEIFFARSTDGGARFDPAINLSNTMAGAGKGRLTARRWDNGSLDLALGPEGRVYAAWTEYEGRLRLSRSSDGGASFAEPVHVAGDHARPARAPALAVGADGRVHLAWTVGEDPAADIHVAASTDGGRSFGPPRIAAPGPGHSDAPRIAVDSQGRLHLVYGESLEGAPGRYRIRYVRLDAGGDRFSEPQPIALPDSGAESLNFPEIAVDAADRLYVLWKRFPDRRNYGRGLGFTVSHDGGESFAAPETVPGSDDPDLGFSGSLQGSLMRRLAVDAEGEVALADSSFAPGRTSRIRLWRRPAAAR